MNETTDIATLLAPLSRRRWLILIVGVLVAAATYAYYARRPAVYSATTQLDLSGGLEAQQTIGVVQGKANLTSRQLADTATLITSSGVAEAVQRRLRAKGVHGHGKVRAKAASETDFVTITAEAAKPRTAALIANAYALAYLERQHLTYSRQIDTALAATRRQLQRIEAAQAAPARSGPTKGKGSQVSKTVNGVGSPDVIQAASLASKINQLESALSVSSIQQVNPATASSAQSLSPKPARNAIFGFFIGVLIVGIAVIVFARLGRRIGSLEQIEEIFKTQVLAVLPKASPPIVQRDGRPAPADELLEPLRRLHTSLQLGDMLVQRSEGLPRTIMFISPDAGDGKSTLVADLALVQRDAGARVVVVEADLRQPVQAGMLSAGLPSGLSEVLTGAISLEGALQSVGVATPPVAVDGERSFGGVSVLAGPSTRGSLSVLASGRAVENPPALLGSPEMRELLQSLAGDFDYVLIDAPPPLEVSDAMPLLHRVDGIVLVARPDHTRQATAERLRRLLAASSTAPLLGVVVNAVPKGDITRYGFSSSYSERRWPSRPDR